MGHFFRSIYCVIKCVKTKRVLKRKFASQVLNVLTLLTVTHVAQKHTTLLCFHDNTGYANMCHSYAICTLFLLITAEYQITGTEEALREYQESGIIIDASALKRPLKVCEHPFGHRENQIFIPSPFFSKNMFRGTLSLTQENYHFIVQIEKNKCSQWTKSPRTCITSYHTAHSNFQFGMRLCSITKIFTFSR
jgi:hypothetical protein